MKDIITLLTQLNAPAKIIVALFGIFAVLQVTGELIELKGTMVPEFMKIRKFFARKRKERETLTKITETFATMQEIPNTLKNVQDLLAQVNCHYNADNISMRDEWIKNVNHKLEENDKFNKEISQKLDKNNADTLSLLIESQRESIINFAARVVDQNNPVTREQFTRIFKIHDNYEETIKANHLTNDEINIAYRIIKDSYEEHLRNHSFIEDVRGYN